MKRIAIFCDGTWNGADQARGGEPCPTNVVKLSLRVAPRANDARQIVYYGEGISGNTEPVLLHHSQGRLVPASFTNLITNTATREANTTAGFSAIGNVTITQENLNNETYVKVVSNQSSSTPGVYPIGGTISVKPGESYSLKVLGYQSVGSTAALYVKNANGGDILWPGAALPIGAGSEVWTTSTFTVPAGVTQIAVGVLWNGVSSGHTFYINRIALYKTDWEYQYFLNDHLGSTRVVLQTTPHIFTYVATMESANHAQENTQFFNLSSANEIPSPGNATPGGSKAYLMNATYKTGPARSFRVLPGDVIDASVMAWYPGGGTYAKNSLTTMGAAIASALGGGTTAIIDGINGSYASSSGNPNFLLSPDQGSGKPSAFLNYILFNEHYQPIEAKSQPVGNTANALHAVVLPSISVKETGYLFIYLSFDNTAGEVHFDELKITYQESPVVQINAYYPYGMTALNWTRDGELENRYNFQGKEYENKTEWHNFHARQYDATIGRWFATDPANQFSSPYLAMGNNPVMMIDPDGRFSFKNFIQNNTFLRGFYDARRIVQAFSYSNDAGWATTKQIAIMRGIEAGVALATAWVGSALGPVGSATVGNSIFLTELTRAGLHGTINGLASEAMGGSFKNGFYAGAASSLIGSSLHNAPGLLQIAGSSMAGGLSSHLSGGSFEDGAIRGAIIASVNHLAHKGTQPPRTYKVKKGETLYSISKKFGMTVSEFKNLYGISNNQINAGQILRINSPEMRFNQILRTKINYQGRQVALGKTPYGNYLRDDFYHRQDNSYEWQNLNFVNYKFYPAEQWYQVADYTWWRSLDWSMKAYTFDRFYTGN